MQAADKLVGMVVALVAFAVVIGAILLVVHLLERRGARRVAWWFIGPTLLLIAVGLVYPPALRTVWRSLYDAAGTSFIGSATTPTSSRPANSSSCCATRCCGCSSRRSSPRSSG